MTEPATSCCNSQTAHGGFLRAVTGQNWIVEETACLGLGDGSCEFLIRVDANGGHEHGG